MHDPYTLQETLGLALSGHGHDTPARYADALTTVVLTLGPEEIEAHAAWFDYDEVAESRVHVRLLLASGVVALDHEFASDVAPEARFVPWSRIDRLHVVGKHPHSPRVTNAWLMTADGPIELAGAGSPRVLAALVTAARAHLR